MRYIANCWLIYLPLKFGPTYAIIRNTLVYNWENEFPKELIIINSIDR